MLLSCRLQVQENIFNYFTGRLDTNVSFDGNLISNLFIRN